MRTVVLDRAPSSRREHRKHSTIARLLQLWRLAAEMDLIWLTRDYKTALIYIFTDLVTSASAIMGMFLLAQRFDGVGPWSRSDVLFMLGYAMLVNTSLDMFFGFNIKTISRRIGRGQLDHVLIQPQPLWMALATEGFTPFEYPIVLALACGLLIVAGRGLGISITPLWFLFLLLNLVASGAIVLAFQFCWGSLAFWAPRAAEEINWSTDRMIGQLGAFPLDGVGSGLLAGMLTAVPVGFAAWFPCRALLGLSHTPRDIAVAPLASIAFVAVAWWFCKKGLRLYERTGSQRYLAFGHRR
jgi:ABC-2 type transport system permease protein